VNKLEAQEEIPKAHTSQMVLEFLSFRIK